MIFRINEKTNEVCFDISEFVKETDICDEEKAFAFLREMHSDVINSKINATIDAISNKTKEQPV